MRAARVGHIRCCPAATARLRCSRTRRAAPCRRRRASRPCSPRSVGSSVPRRWRPRVLSATSAREDAAPDRHALQAPRRLSHHIPAKRPLTPDPCPPAAVSDLQSRTSAPAVLDAQSAGGCASSTRKGENKAGRSGAARLRDLGAAPAAAAEAARAGGRPRRAPRGARSSPPRPASALTLSHCAAVETLIRRGIAPTISRRRWPRCWPNWPRCARPSARCSTHERAADLPPKTTCPRSRVLLVDDEVNLLLTSIALRERGFHITEATSGEQAMRTLTGAARHGGALDALMPGLDGFGPASQPPAGFHRCRC